MQQDPDFYNQGGAPSGFSPNAVPPQNGQPAGRNLRVPLRRGSARRLRAAGSAL